MRTEAYRKIDLNSEFFASANPRIQDYFKSTAYCFTTDRIKDGYTFLNIGGAGGAAKLSTMTWRTSFPRW